MSLVRLENQSLVLVRYAGGPEDRQIGEKAPTQGRRLHPLKL